MQLTRPKSVYRTQSLAMRVDRAGENRFAVALIAILSLATLSVLATTSALSPTRRRPRDYRLAVVSREG
jgi:hypothetical protein